MRIIIAVTDACIFIDMYELGLVNSFFDLDVEVHTSSIVMFELHREQQNVLKAYQSINKLTVHNLGEEDFLDIYATEYPKFLSEADKSVLHIANKLNACVLSSDKALRNGAKNKTIQCHGIIWMFDKLVEEEIIHPKEAAYKLQQLITLNFTFRNNLQLVQEIEKRLKQWSSTK